MSHKPLLDDHGHPVRCIDCNGMFSAAPKIWAERGPICGECQAITEGMAASGARYWLGSETYGDRRYEIVDPPMMKPSPLNGQPGRRRVAIVGFDSKTRGSTPLTDPEWDIWGMNAGHLIEGLFLREGVWRADRWFQIHPPNTLSRREQHWMQELGYAVHTPTYIRPADVLEVQRRWNLASLDCVPYPIERVRARFPYGLFASTMCLEVALALLEGYEEIGLYGCEARDMGREIVCERPALAYWIGVAHTLGVTVTVPGTSTIGTYPYVYGFDYLEEAGFAAMLTEEVIPRRWIHERDGGNLNTVAAVQEFAAKLE